MKFELRFAPEAEETYDDLTQQLRDRWGDLFVYKFEEKIKRSIANVIENPFMYPILEEVIGIRRCVLHKNCSMLYIVNDDVIVIICFWDNRQDPLTID